MIERIDHIVMNCRDVETTAAWYERTLGLRRETYTSPSSPGVVRTALKFGRNKFNLRQTGDKSWWTCRTETPGGLDLCFLVEGSLKPMLERWKAAGVTVAAGPGPRTGAEGTMTSIYAEDPDGNLIEVATYAKDALA